MFTSDQDRNTAVVIRKLLRVWGWGAQEKEEGWGRSVGGTETVLNHRILFMGKCGHRMGWGGGRERESYVEGSLCRSRASSPPSSLIPHRPRVHGIF